MPKISDPKKEKIQEQILLYLFDIDPSAAFTNKIAQEIARDEEFTKSLLKELKERNLVICISKNSLGNSYIRRQRWRLSAQTYEVYKNSQSK